MLSTISAHKTNFTPRAFLKYIICRKCEITGCCDATWHPSILWDRFPFRWTQCFMESLSSSDNSSATSQKCSGKKDPIFHWYAPVAKWFILCWKEKIKIKKKFKSLSSAPYSHCKRPKRLHQRGCSPKASAEHFVHSKIPFRRSSPEIPVLNTKMSQS